VVLKKIFSLFSLVLKCILGIIRVSEIWGMAYNFGRNSNSPSNIMVSFKKIKGRWWKICFWYVIIPLGEIISIFPV